MRYTMMYRAHADRRSPRARAAHRINFVTRAALGAATVRERLAVPPAPPLADGTVKKRGDTAAARCRGRGSQSYPAMSPDFFTDARGSQNQFRRASPRTYPR